MTPLRVASPGHAAFAAVMIALGVQGLITGELTAVWQPIPNGVPAREALVYLCALVSLACGTGLLVSRTAAIAARTLLAYLLLWSLVFRIPVVVRAPFGLLPWYSCAETGVVVSGAWVLYTWFATDRDRQRFGFAAGDGGVRIARVLYGLCMIPFAFGHFIYIQRTTEMVPKWLPAHAAWAYFFGGTFLAAGIGLVFGILDRLAAVLSTVQVGLFTVLVWIPILAAGAKDYELIEFVTSVAIVAGGWVVADSYRRVPSRTLFQGASRSPRLARMQEGP